MTQALDRPPDFPAPEPAGHPTLAIRLTPMDVPAARPWVTGDATGQAIAATTGMTPVVNPLTLHPGEPTEATVAIENLSDRPLDLRVMVTGDFPAQWCRVLRSRQRVAAGDRLNSILVFQVPPAWFETSTLSDTPESSDPTARRATPDILARRGQLQVFAGPDPAAARLLRTVDFHLYLRPRSRYLDRLPSLYREVDFVGRLLKIFELAFEPANNTLDSLWAYLNPRLAPEALLPFLAHWVGWELLPELPLDRQRDLMARAIEIYRWRGTRRGLRLSLHLATGLPLDEDYPDETQKHISIREAFGPGLVLGQTRLGRDAILGGTRPFHFSVVLQVPADFPVDADLVRTTIEREKPAFCTYDLAIAGPPPRFP